MQKAKQLQTRYVHADMVLPKASPDPPSLEILDLRSRENIGGSTAFPFLLLQRRVPPHAAEAVIYLASTISAINADLCIDLIDNRTPTRNVCQST